MTKKCIICREEAEFRIKDNNEFYCYSCALDNFEDLNLLEKIEDDASKIKRFLKERLENEEDKTQSNQVL